MDERLVQEVIEEIGTLTLAKFGLNIFSLNTYAAYESSVLATNDVSKMYKQHKNNHGYYGHAFEAIDVGQNNIKDSLLNTGNKTYTTDVLGDIQKVQGIHREKNIQNLNPKDRDKYDYYMKNYGDEVEKFDFSKKELNDLARKNHNITDTVTLDKNGIPVKSAQLKVIKNTNDLLKERYLEGDSAVDELRVPFDDYKRHKDELEKIIRRGEESNNENLIARGEKAKAALEKLNANNVANRIMCENPKTTAIVMQSISAGAHVAQAGLSDAIVVALSTLANGLICEIRDMFSGKPDSELSIMDRVKRLLNRIIEAFKKSFVRGAGFGSIDAAVGILGQIFTSITSSLKLLWKQTRNSLKSIYNAIYSYVSDEIKSMRDLISAILKALFSSAWAVSTVALESKLAVELSVLLGPISFLAHFLAPAFAIVVGAFSVVLTSRAIDSVLDVLFGVFASKNMAKKRADEIATLVITNLEPLMSEGDRLQKIIEDEHRGRLLSADSSFSDYQKSCQRYDEEGVYRALNSMSLLWGRELQIKDIDDMQKILENRNRCGKLIW